MMHLAPAVFGENGFVGGAERYAMELARHMADILPTSFVAFGDKSEEWQMDQLRVRILGPAHYVRGQRVNPIASSLLSEIRQVDVVHCHQQHVLASSLASAACRLTGRKVYVSDLGGGGWDISAYLSTDRWYQGHLHISQYSKEIFGHTNKSWAHVIYGGVDTDKFSPDDSIERDGTVVFVGRLLPHKGINYLIEACPADMPLELIGRPYDDRYFEDLQKLAVGKKVIFRTNCDDAMVVHAYRRAMCVVLPSVYRTIYGSQTKIPELLGQTALEGMACGAPSVCTRVASLPEVVDDGVTGFLVSPNDPEALRSKLLWLRYHQAETKAMGHAARRHVLEKFSWDTVVEKCLSIYRI